MNNAENESSSHTTHPSMSISNESGIKWLETVPQQNVINEINDVVYAQVFEVHQAVQSLHLNLLIPQTNTAKATIVYFPGGGFLTAYHHKFIQMRMALAQAGFIVVAANYRTIPAQFPAPIVDAKAAVRYLRAHAKDYGIDPTRIGVLGDSAGGWVAQMLGTTATIAQFEQGDFLEQSTEVQAVVSLYGISNLLNIGAGFDSLTQKIHQTNAVTEALLLYGPAFKQWAGSNINESPEKALWASPLGHINSKKPPFLIMHGSADSIVSIEQSTELYNALKAQESPAEYVVVKNADHGDVHWYQPAVITSVVNWFQQVFQPN